jgi:WD40 repeat protein
MFFAYVLSNSMIVVRRYPSFEPVLEFEYEFAEPRIALSPDWSLLAVGNPNIAHVQLIDVQTGRELMRLGVDGCERMVFPTNDRIVVYFDFGITDIDIMTNESRIVNIGSPLGCLSPNGEFCVIDNNSRLSLVNTETGTTIARFPIVDSFGAVSFSGDSRRFLAPGWFSLSVLSVTGEIVVILCSQENYHGLSSAALNSDGTRLAVFDMDDNLRVGDVEDMDGARVLFKDPGVQDYHLAFMADGGLVYVNSWEKRIRFFPDDSEPLEFVHEGDEGDFMTGLFVESTGVILM